MRLKSLVLALFIVMLSASFAFAKPTVKVGGEFWADYAIGIAANGAVSNGFSIDRLHMVMAGKINKYFSAKVVLDVVPTFFDTASSTAAFQPYVKVGAIVAKMPIGSTTIGFKAGVIDTPYIVYTTVANGDLWLNGDPMAATGDKFFDLGAGIFVNSKYASFYATVTNGEGFKNITKYDTNNNKAYAARLSATPLKQLSISVMTYILANNIGIYSGNVLGQVYWKSKLVKAGISYAQILSNVSNNGFVIDAWANLNLDPIISLPILIALSNETVGTIGSPLTSDTLGVGVGYSFTKGVNVMALYEGELVGGSHKVSIKTQFKF